MTELAPKTIAESAVILSEIILPAHTNAVGNAHGGELLKIMDSAAGACAVKHSRSIVVTAGVDNVTFHAPVFLGNLAICHAHLTFVSNRSMEIAVNIDAEDMLQGTRKCCLTAYFILVALDEKTMSPKPIAQLDLQNDAERREFAAGQLRMEERKKIPRVCWLPLY
ncbi:MAG: acyl-CoA thioesterase [Deltaproteobacteria bacterium HGW-Deltaproteobacteria-13]|jgi:acyl-CoA hydrolase|nr:MAG: acyl-CoA thioesterase [Deltaproteobacteria bacterium HGW-Deltaproteobacteria-13]